LSEVIKQKIKFSRPKRIPKCALGQCPAASRTKQALTFACAAAFAAMRATTKQTRLKGGRHLVGASHDPPVRILISKCPVLPPFSCKRRYRGPWGGPSLCQGLACKEWVLFFRGEHPSGFHRAKYKRHCYHRPIWFHQAPTPPGGVNARSSTPFFLKSQSLGFRGWRAAVPPFYRCQCPPVNGQTMRGWTPSGWAGRAGGVTPGGERAEGTLPRIGRAWLWCRALFGQTCGTPVEGCALGPLGCVSR